MTYGLWRDRLLEGVDQLLYPAEWLDLRVSQGSARFWCNDEAAILAEIRLFPSGAREVHGMVAAGEIEAIKALIPLAEQWGRECGCIRAIISSHPSWSRIMRDEGYEPSQLMIVKEL